MLLSDLQLLNTSGTDICIDQFQKLTNAEAIELREKITSLLNAKAENIYLNASEVTEVSIAGINEIINCHYMLTNANKKFVLVYRTDSVMQTWLAATGIQKYMQTAQLPKI